MDIPYLDFHFDPKLIVRHVVMLGMACLLALPIGWDREASGRRMGLRTFPLVAVASAAYVLIAREALGDSAAPQARIVQGLITGIGFLGGGAIVKQGLDVQGTATAASIWTTAALGAAVAYGRYEIAIVLSVLNFLTLRFLTPVKKHLGTDGESPEEGADADERADDDERG